MCSPWLRLTKITLLPFNLRNLRFSEKVLYDLNPDDSIIRNKIPYSRSNTTIPFFHTVIVHDIPAGKSQAEKIKIFEDSLPQTLKIDYFWCPESKCPEHENSPGESVFIVCYDAETATAVLEYLPQITVCQKPLAGEIYAPKSDGRRGTREHIEELRAWSNIVFWAGFVGKEFVLGVGLRGSSKENDQDLRWTVNHHLHYVPEHQDEKGEVTVWLSAVEKDWKPALRGQAESIRKVTRIISSEIKGSMNHNKNKIGLRLVFEKESHAKYLKEWLSEKAVDPIPVRERTVEIERWYIFNYARKTRRRYVFGG